MAPRGRKVKEGIANQMDVYNGNKGLRIMLLMGYIIGRGIGKTEGGIKWPLEIYSCWLYSQIYMATKQGDR